MSAEDHARTHAQQFSWWQGKPDLHPDLASLKDLAALRDAVSELIAEQVSTARDGGATWTAIGEQLDISKQAASKRFGSNLS